MVHKYKITSPLLYENKMHEAVIKYNNKPRIAENQLKKHIKV